MTASEERRRVAACAMKIRLLPLLALLLAVPFAAVADPVDSVAASVRAAAFLQSLHPASRTTAGGVLTSLEAGPAAYGFADGRGGFVLVAADDRLPDILGYGQAGDEMPPALRELLALYGRQLPTPPGTRAAATPSTPAVQPLLSTVRDQYDPFNRSCPYYVDDEGNVSAGRCIVGCVATALEQVMTYYRQPAVLADTVHAHSTAHFTTSDVLPGTAIAWDDILDSYEDGLYTDAQAAAVADLSLWCGQICKMNWGTESSGAYVNALVPGMERAMGYGFVHYADSYKYRPDDWFEMLVGEITSGRPVLYAGSQYARSAHAFVLDGLDTEGRYHVNWGYGGSYDGYFRLDVLAFANADAEAGGVDQSQGFFCNQEAVLLHPGDLDIALPDTLARTGQELRVTAVSFEREPDTNGAVAVRIGLHNTSDEPLTTPIALLTQLPDAEDPFEGADYLCYTGSRLAAGADTAITAYACFTRSGERLLYFTADGETVFHTQPVTVAAADPAELSVVGISVEATADSAIAHVTFHNGDGGGWSGAMPTFSLYEGTHDSGSNDTRRYAHLNLPPGGDTTVTVRFGGLRASTLYDLCVRLDWDIVANQTFTTSPSTGITTIEGEDADSEWFTPEGRRVDRPARPGIYIERRGGTSRKVYRPTR